MKIRTKISLIFLAATVIIPLIALLLLLIFKVPIDWLAAYLSIFLAAAAVLGLSGYLIVFWFREGIAVLQLAATAISDGHSDLKSAAKIDEEFRGLIVIFKKIRENISRQWREDEKRLKETTQKMQVSAKVMADQQKAILNILEDVNEEQAQLETLSAIVRDAEEPINRQDLDGTIISWNHGAEKLYGYAAEEMIGQSIETIIPKNKREEYRKLSKMVAKGKAIEHSQTLRQKKDGSLVEVAISLAPVKDAFGWVVGLSSIALDITKEKQIDKTKTEFVSLASHQLRSPLTAVGWYAGMLLHGDAGELTARQKEYLDAISTSNRHMNELVGALLNVSRLELGTFAVEPKAVNLELLAQEVISELKPQLKAKQQSFRFVYDDELPRLRLDPQLMRIIFQNLLTNAIKYTPAQGKIALKIVKDQEHFLIKVSDTGYGIPQNQQEKIFSKLFRADNIRTKSIEGTGLGLYIIKSVIDTVGGKIWFESKENKGTTFFVQLPLSGMKKKVGSKGLS